MLRLTIARFVGLFLALGTAVSAQSPQAAPPADTLVQSVITLVQTGDLSRRGQVLARILSSSTRAKDSARIDRLINALALDGAPYDVVKIDSVGRHAFVRLRSRRVPRALLLDVAADRGGSGMIDDIDVLESHATVLDSVEWPATRLPTRAALVSLVRHNLDRLAAGGAFSGTVYIARRDTVVFARGYGFSDLEDSVRNGVRTRFTIASMGKMFTATAILQLVEAGKFRLDDTLAKVLPSYPNAERAARVTVRQLLEHSAGMGDQWSTPRKPVPGLTGALAYAAAVAYPPLHFEPGTRWSYSNEGYSVLAAIVEHHSGETFVEYVQRHVLDRAGMKETSLRTSGSDIVPRRAVGYYPADDDPLGIRSPRANWTFAANGGFGGAGGGYSTVGDLARFGKAMREGRLLAAALRDSMWTGKWDIAGYEGERYGLGSFVANFGDRTAVGHGGGGGYGIDTGFRYFTDGSWTVVVLTNINPPTATNLTKSLTKLLAAQR